MKGMAASATVYGAVYQAVADAGSGGGVRAGTHGSILTAIDTLRRCAAPAEHIKLAEGIAVSLHKLGWALQGRVEADEKAARDELRAASVKWLDTPLRFALVRDA